MKTIGLIGGMSWESTQTYYQLINQRVRDELGRLHSARLVLYSLDFAEIEALQHQGDWAATGEILGAVGKALAAAGADFIVLCTNTMHKVADSIEKASGLPMLHIADATADALHRDEIDCVGLLGTKFTMEQAFYKERLENRGIRVLVPGDAQREFVHTVIYDELCRGIIRQPSKLGYLQVLDSLAARGAQGVILGCTEIGLLVQQADTAISLYDTTRIHAEQAVAHALA
ncbi:aspartate/glutamate racemase family protein [Marinobacter sp. ST-43]|uniref:aspartate/glutamate racemase family protein n=1 Tax=Marinobacter sp. ST-43 TaxID=3050453 RepID=UPI0026E0E408|nr:aspartate/glutamate racemase family protein [Marinobacter sp. ST-43]